MKKRLFQNPVAFLDGKEHTNPDPFVMQWCGSYYCYATDADGVKVSVSKDLITWEDCGFAISQEGYHDFWAPAVVYRNGVFYMYYSNNPVGEDDGNGEKMQLATATSPKGPFVWQKTLFPTFSIDAHPVVWKGEVYLFYSVNNWVGNHFDAPGTCILVDKLVAPDRLEGRPVPVVLPGMEQEIYERNRFGDGRDWYTIEGACFVPGKERSFLLYSANCYTDVNYFVGYSVAENKADLRDMVWEKYTLQGEWAPLIRKSEQVEGTGHNTVAYAPNLSDLFMVHHGRDATREIIPGQEQRVMHVAPMEMGTRTLHMAPPTTDAQMAPALPDCFYDTLTLKDCEEVTIAPMPRHAAVQMWLCPTLLHTGARYGIVLGEDKQGNRLEVQFHSGQNTVFVYETVGHIQTECCKVMLPSDYDHFVPHLLQVHKVNDTYRLTLDETALLTIAAQHMVGSMKLCTYFSELTVSGLAISETLRLEGRELVTLGELFEASHAVAVEEGLVPAEKSLCLKREAPIGEAEILSVVGRGTLTICAGEHTLVTEQLTGEETVYRLLWEEDGVSVYRNGIYLTTAERGQEIISLERSCLALWGYTKIYHDWQKS